MNDIFKIIGALGTSSFVLIALGDFVTGVVNMLVQKLLVPKNTPWSNKIVFYWNLLDSAYDDFRGFLNRISVYSRSRPALSRGTYDRKES